MWIEASFTKNDLVDLGKQLSPVEVRLGSKGGFLRLTDLREVYLIPTVGLHVVCSGHLDWPILGLKVPVTLHSLRVRVRPEIDKRALGDVLQLKIEVEHVDVAAIPDVVDDTITEMLNRELARKEVRLEWDFTSMLSRVFTLPAAFANPRSLALQVIGGNVRIAEDALILAVAFEAETAGVTSQRIGEYAEVHAS